MGSGLSMRGRKGESKGQDSVPGMPSDPPSVIPLPDKKILELILDKLQKKDTYGVYAEPVDPEELPNYHDVIEHPMDFATVRKKLANGSYLTLEQFEFYKNFCTKLDNIMWKPTEDVANPSVLRSLTC